MGRPVLLVGSIPLGTVTEVFDAAASHLGGLARRLPDGEVGPRLEWIAWQKDTMSRTKGIEVGGYREIQGGAVKYTQYRIKPDLTAQDVEFGPLGYAEVAKASYAEFKQQRESGKNSDRRSFPSQPPNPACRGFRVFCLLRHPDDLAYLRKAIVGRGRRNRFGHSASRTCHSMGRGS